LFSFPVAQEPNTGPGSVIVEISRSHTIRHTTVGRTPLDEGSARCRDLYLTSHNNTRDEKPCPQGDSNPQSQKSKRPQTCTSDRAATGIGLTSDYCI